MKFDKDNICSLRCDLDTELSRLATNMHGMFPGITLKLGKAGYNDTTVEFKLEAVLPDETGNIQTKQEGDFKRYASRYGLVSNDLGRIFITSNGSYQIVGLKPRNRKYSILAINDSDGKTYKFHPMKVRDAFGRQDKAQGV